MNSTKTDVLLNQGEDVEQILIVNQSLTKMLVFMIQMEMNVSGKVVIVK